MSDMHVVGRETWLVKFKGLGNSKTRGVDKGLTRKNWSIWLTDQLWTVKLKTCFKAQTRLFEWHDKQSNLNRVSNQLIQVDQCQSRLDSSSNLSHLNDLIHKVTWIKPQINWFPLKRVQNYLIRSSNLSFMTRQSSNSPSSMLPRADFKHSSAKGSRCAVQNLTKDLDSACLQT